MHLMVQLIATFILKVANSSMKWQKNFLKTFFKKSLIYNRTDQLGFQKKTDMAINEIWRKIR